ncbi:MAG: hypothetical protein ACI4TJ_02835 [Candidatus Cryptobacteroides sp.]
MDKKESKDIYRVPEGYFSDLRSRLYTIAGETGTGHRGFFSVIMPYAALAACFVALVVAGNAILSRTAGEYATDPETEYYADLLATHPGMFYQEEYALAEETASEDEIIDYLIESGSFAGELLTGE